MVHALIRSLILIGFYLSISASDISFAQCTGQFQAGQVCGNIGLTQAPPTAFNLLNYVWPAVQYASLFPGASVGAQIDAACAALGGQYGLVVIPSTMGLGNSIIGLPNGCHIYDLRGTSGPDQFGTPGSGGFLNQILIQSRSTSGPNNVNLQALQVAQEAFSGGSNASGGPKTNYSGIYITASNRTLGQSNGLSFTSTHFSNGDTVGLDGYAQSWGRNNATGDEGTEGATIGAYQGDIVMSATVSGVSGTTISYTSTTNENTRGEARPLIITTPAKVYSTGTVSSITGTPPTVTGSGTTWTSLGSGPVSNLFFSLNAQTNGSLMLVIPVRSITDDTHLVLDYVSEGVDSSYPVSGAIGAYKIFKGGNVTALSSPAGSFTVVPAGDFSVSDTVQQPLGYAHTIVGLHLSVSQKLPFSSNASGSAFQIANIGDQTFANVGIVSGAFSKGFEFQGVTTVGFQFDNNLSGGILSSADFASAITTKFLQVPTSVGQNTFFSYENTFDTWFTTQPIRVPMTTVSGLSAFPCNGTTQGARMGVRDAMSPTFLGSLTGSGSTVTPVFCNGTSWVAG